MQSPSSQEDALCKMGNLDTRIVEGLNDSVAILDLEGRLQHINAAGRRLLECADGSMIEKPFAQLFDRKGMIAVQQAVADASKGKSSQFMVSSRSSTVKMKWWDVTVSPIMAADGSVTQILTISRDLTDKVRKEEFRALEHRMLEKITSGGHLDDVLAGLVLLIEQYSEDTICCVLLLGEDGKTVQHSSAPNFSEAYLKAVHGLPVGPRVGSCGTAMFRKSRVIVEDIFSDPLWEGFDEIKILSGGRACWSTPILLDDEVVGSFAIYARKPRQPTPDELNLMDSAAQFVRVSIDKHRNQQALRHSESRNRAMLCAIPDWVFLTTPEGMILDYHVRDPSTLPVAPSSALGRSICDVISEPLGTELRCVIERVSGSGKQEDLKGSLKSGDEERHFETSIVRCDGDNVLSIVRDVTEQKRAELAATAQRAELAHLGRVALLGEITGALAHELSQPLAIMRTNADVARRVLDSDDLRLDLLRETLDDIVSSNRRAGGVIDRLRALLRKEEPNFQRIDLDDVARDVVELAQSEIITRGISLRRSSNRAVSSVWGDRIQLQQVILNLVLNARDAMANTPERERQLWITTESDGECIELAVSDTGIGIPGDDLERVFQPFVSHGKKGVGLGLGLAICRSIVDAHQGSIRAENNEGGGATFRCRFPLVNTVESRQAEATSTPPHSKADV